MADLNPTLAPSRTPEYRVWAGMIQRCSSTRRPEAKNYSLRGITVCSRWRESFRSFLADMGRRPSPKHSIDRIDNDGNYEPGNCRWATAKEQRRNRQSVRLLTVDGRTMCIQDWAIEKGIDQATILYRVNSGWSDERAVNTLPDRRYSELAMQANSVRWAKARGEAVPARTKRSHKRMDPDRRSDRRHAEGDSTPPPKLPCGCDNHGSSGECWARAPEPEKETR